MTDVIFYEAFDEEEAALRQYLPHDLKAQFTPKTIQESGDREPPSGIISIRTQSVIPEPWSGKIKAVLTRSQGFDHLAAFRRETGTDAALGYLGAYCSRAVAEQAVMIMLCLFRRIKLQINQFNTFDRDGLTGLECRGRKAFVLGVGNIGKEIVDICRGLRMEVKGFDIDRKVSDLEYVPLEEGLPWADAVLCALPLNDGTENILTGKLLQKMRPEAVVVNVGRGEIMSVQDLKSMLDGDLLGGLGLDVYPQEAGLAHQYRTDPAGLSGEAKAIDALSHHGNVICTPHNAFNTREAVADKARLSIESVLHFIEKGTFPRSVPSQ